MSGKNAVGHHFTKKQLEAFKEARRIHSVGEMVEIQDHSVYEWTGVYRPLNDLTVEQLHELLKGESK